MLAISNLTIQFGAKPLFENVSVKFDEGGRYGLIGANGTGKSTLVKILADKLEATSGTVTIGPQQRLGVLGQDQFAFEEFTPIQTVMMGHAELWEVSQKRDHLYSLADMTEAQGMEVAELEVRFAELDGYTAESRASELLSGVGIAQELHYVPMSEVAPGLKLRVLLTQVLFSDPDILLLDEPTNNLDINTIRWLENVLVQRKSTMIIISHDRHFLNAVCTHMADLDYGELRIYHGNYDDYMTAAAMMREKQMTEKARADEKIKQLQQFVDRFAANAAKARQATSRAREIEKLRTEDIKPSSRKSPFIRFLQEKKLHRNALTLTNISNGYDEGLLFKELTLHVQAGQRLAVIGPNGIGKTTLLRTLMNELPVKSGQVQWAEAAKVGYFAQQHQADFQIDMTLLEWMWQWGTETDDEQSIRGILGRMLFSRKDVDKKVNVLSGGEQGRMLFGKLILQKPNVMVLDEPTNHMDMESIEALQYALSEYDGTLIFVSHDREFVSSLATQVLELMPTRSVHYQGGYEDYLLSQEPA